MVKRREYEYYIAHGSRIHCACIEAHGIPQYSPQKRGEQNKQKKRRQRKAWIKEVREEWLNSE